MKDNPKVVLDAQERALPQAAKAARSLSSDILRLKETSGWSDLELADFFGTSRTTIEHWRYGECPKNIELIYSIRFTTENLSSLRH
jgi:DNA-binding transcriptional regulator YiaG